MSERHYSMSIPGMTISPGYGQGYEKIAALLGITESEAVEHVVKPALERGVVRHGDYRIYGTVAVSQWFGNTPYFTIQFRVVLAEQGG